MFQRPARPPTATHCALSAARPAATNLFGNTTRRRRRCDWWLAPPCRTSAWISAPRSSALTRADRAIRARVSLINVGAMMPIRVSSSPQVHQAPAQPPTEDNASPRSTRPSHDNGTTGQSFKSSGLRGGHNDLPMTTRAQGRARGTVCVWCGEGREASGRGEAPEDAPLRRWLRRAIERHGRGRRTTACTRNTVELHGTQQVRSRFVSTSLHDST